MTEITTCSTSNCDNPATVKAADTSVPMLVCGACWHAMMMVETETTMGEADRAAARQLVKDWCDPRVPKGWEMRAPGYIVCVGPALERCWVDVRDRWLRSDPRVPVEIVDIAMRSIIAGMAPALAGTLTSALDDGDCLRGVIARALRASDSIADNDAEDVIQEMLAILLEAEPEGRDDTVEWARMEGANAMLELIVAAGYGARGISDNREGLRKEIAKLAVAATMPRKPEAEFDAALLQREVEQLRAQLAEANRQRNVLAAGLQTMAEAHYDAWSEDWPEWVVVPMDDGLGLWINEGEERTILEMHHKDYAAMGTTAAAEAGRLVVAVNNSMKLAAELAEQGDEAKREVAGQGESLNAKAVMIAQSLDGISEEMRPAKDSVFFVIEVPSSDAHLLPMFKAVDLKVTVK